MGLQDRRGAVAVCKAICITGAGLLAVIFLDDFFLSSGVDLVYRIAGVHQFFGTLYEPEWPLACTELPPAIVAGWAACWLISAPRRKASKIVIGKGKERLRVLFASLWVVLLLVGAYVLARFYQQESAFDLVSDSDWFLLGTGCGVAIAGAIMIAIGLARGQCAVWALLATLWAASLVACAYVLAYFYKDKAAMDGVMALIYMSLLATGFGLALGAVLRK